jgi:hypothetical protein
MITKLKGSHPWLVILCCPSDRSVPTLPAPEYFAGFISGVGTGGLFDYWSQLSGGRFDLAGSRVLGWYRLTQTVAQIDAIDRSAAAAVARAAATAAGEDVTGYRYTLALFVGSGHFGNQGEDIAAGINDTRGQPGWRWCSKCEGLAFWDGSREPGPCAATGRHDHSGSAYYSIEHDTTISDGQAGWRWCRQCETIIFLTSSPAACPAGGNHALSSSFQYVIRMGSTSPDEQNNWKWCVRCQGLAYDDPGRGPGPCPVGGRHDHSGSANYSLPIAWSATVGAFSHESGHCFGFTHAFGPSRSGDLFNDTRPGAYGDWTDIMSWANTAMFASPRYTPAGSGLSAPMLHKLGWVNEGEVARVHGAAGTQLVSLVPLYGTTTGTRMVQVIRAPENRIYTASYRPATGWDQGFRTDRVVVHEQRTLYSSGQDGWFWCSSCEGMIFGGEMLCPAGGCHDGTASGIYSLLHDVGPSGGQTNWRWCSKCQGLAFAGNGTEGHCPAGAGHDLSRSFDYAIPMSGSGQSNWRWCRKCQGMAYGGQAMKGACPAGGLHDYSRSANYVLGNGVDPQRQNKWRWCNKCQGLFYDGRSQCKGGDTHQLSGSDYALALNLDRAFGQSGWKWCSKCYGLAFHDGSRAAGACPSGGSHDHGASGRYIIPTDSEAAVAQQSWFHCSRCSAVHYVDAARGAGPCGAGGRHSSDREYEVARDTTAVAGDVRFRWCRRCECLVLETHSAGCAAIGSHDMSASSRYVVRTNPATLAQEESFWRTCAQCGVLMRLLSPDAAAESPCSAGGRHLPQGEYFLTLRTHVSKWRWCRRCELLALWDGSRAAGPCPAGGRHDHSGSDFYLPPRRGEEAIQLVADNLIAGSSYAAEIGGTTIEVVSMSPTLATLRVTT